MEHTLKDVQEGCGNIRTITPTCSCGWKGYGVAAYNDDQLYQIGQQKKYHVREAERAARMDVNAR